MKYRVAFRERTSQTGDPVEDPSGYVDFDLPEGVIVDAVLVERIEPDALHPQQQLDEDDSFLSLGTEVWEYEVAEGRESDFEAALANSQVVMEFEVMDEVGDE